MSSKSEKLARSLSETHGLSVEAERVLVSCIVAHFDRSKRDLDLTDQPKRIYDELIAAGLARRLTLDEWFSMLDRGIEFGDGEAIRLWLRDKAFGGREVGECPLPVVIVPRELLTSEVAARAVNDALGGQGGEA